MDTKSIKTLIRILEDSHLESLSYKEGNVEIVLTKAALSTAPVVASAVAPTPVAAAPQMKNTVNSPLVGIFYSRSAPDKEPFVAVGNRVEKGDILCIIEAMKVMNEIKADKSGTIQKVLVEDGAMVEFDQPLFSIG